MGNSDLGSDEFDTIFELILTIIFTSFGLFALFQMINVMNTKIELFQQKDKIEVVSRDHQVEDPYWFTAYEAYMIGIVYDEDTNTTVTWLGKDDSGTKYVSNSNNKYNLSVISTVDSMLDKRNEKYNYTVINICYDNGERIEGFDTWKQKQCFNAKTNHCLARTIASVGDTQNDEFFAGKYTVVDKPVMYHLEFTPKYNAIVENVAPLGITLEKRRNSKWVLIPTLQE